MQVMWFLRVRSAEKPARIFLGLKRGSIRALDSPRLLLAQKLGRLISELKLLVEAISSPPFWVCFCSKVIFGLLRSAKLYTADATTVDLQLRKRSGFWHSPLPRLIEAEAARCWLAHSP